MSRVRNAMTAALSGGASAANAVPTGADEGAAREADFRSLLSVERQDGREPQGTGSRMVADDERENGRRSGVDQALADLAGQERRAAGAPLRALDGQGERLSGARGGSVPVSEPPAGEPAAAAERAAATAKTGKPAPATHPDSFASSIRSGAFRGQTTAGGKGVRAWVQAWLNTNGEGTGGDVQGSTGELAGGTQGSAQAGGQAGPVSLGAYLKSTGRIRGGEARSDRGGKPGVDGRPGLTGPQDHATAPSGPRSWVEVLRAQGAAEQAPTAAATPEAAPAVTTPTAAGMPQGNEPFTLAPGAASPSPTAAAATSAAGARPAAAPMAAGDGFAMAEPGAAENGVRIRVPTANGETVRGRMYVDSETRAVRVVLAVQEGGTAQSMSSAHEMLRLRLADEGYQLQSFIVRHDGKSVVRFEDDLAHLAGDGGRDADTADPREYDDTRSRDGRGRENREPIAQAVRPEETVASGWFL